MKPADMFEGLSDDIRAELARVNELERGYFFARYRSGTITKSDVAKLASACLQLRMISADLREHADRNK